MRYPEEMFQILRKWQNNLTVNTCKNISKLAPSECFIHYSHDILKGQWPFKWKEAYVALVQKVSGVTLE